MAGGMIGCTGLVLSRHPSYSSERNALTILKSTRLAGGASGKVGGLLAQWDYRSSLAPLSSGLRMEPAAEHKGAQ